MTIAASPRMVGYVSFILMTAIVGGVLLGSTVSVAANPFVDVPSGHWAYRALEQLSAAALIDGYSPGFFTGARRLTRYEMALSVAGALSRLKGEDSLLAVSDEYDLDQLVLDYNARDPMRPLSAMESDLLRAVVVEFRDELAMLGYSVPNVTVASPSGTPSAPRGDDYVLDGSFEFVARQRLLATRGTGTTRQLVAEVPLDSPDGQQWGAAGTAAGEFSQRVVEVSSAVPLGRIGSTVLFTESHASAANVEVWERTTVPLLDGSIHLSEYALPGARLSDLSGESGLPPFWPGTEKLVGVEVVAVTPYLTLAGERAQRSNLLLDAGATSIRATVPLGADVSLAGSVRTVEPGFDPSDGDAVGLGLTVRLGDILLSTGRDIVQRSQDEDAAHVTTLALEYSLAEQARVRAGWQSVSDTRSRTSVDVNVPVPLGALHLGLAYEGERTENAGISMTTLTMAGLDLRVAANTEARAAFSLEDSGAATERTTSLGLRYTLSPEAALLLGYKFIDFSGQGAEADGRLENVTTAEFSIRF